MIATRLRSRYELVGNLKFVAKASRHSSLARHHSSTSYHQAAVELIRDAAGPNRREAVDELLAGPSVPLSACIKSGVQAHPVFPVVLAIERLPGSGEVAIRILQVEQERRIPAACNGPLSPDDEQGSEPFGRQVKAPM